MSDPLQRSGDVPVSNGEIGLVERRPVYRGRIVDLSVDTVRFPDGSRGEIELIRHPGAAAVLPVLGELDEADPEVLLVRQYRYAGGGYLLEVPAGLPEEGECWEACARRELEEETGYRAGRLHPLTRILTTPGFTNETIHLFAASELGHGVRNRDEDEFMELVPMRLSEALERVRTSDVIDGKSVVTLLWAALFLPLGRLGSPGS